MEISNHNVRQVLSSTELVSQNNKAELNQGQGTAPAPTVPEKPGDVTKVVFSPEAETLKNDLQKKFQGEQNKDKKKPTEAEDEATEETKVTPILNVGKILDVNG